MTATPPGIARRAGFASFRPRSQRPQPGDDRGLGGAINRVNDAGDLVGFYVDAAVNTDGMLAMPQNS